MKTVAAGDAPAGALRRRTRRKAGDARGADSSHRPTTTTVAAGVARLELPSILDEAEKGNTTLILRHSRPSAAVVPARDLEAFNLFRRIMIEVGETLEMSRDPEIIADVKQAQAEIDRGEIVWHDVPGDS